MRSPQAVDERVAALLALLGEKIREQGFTELEVEETLSWDRTHIRQLAAGRKALHIEEVLSI
ncbi:MAG: hypothetical protein GY769_22540, partial [bacterium]|nr:hypothetical protein [bacterium]